MELGTPGQRPSLQRPGHLVLQRPPKPLGGRPAPRQAWRLDGTRSRGQGGATMRLVQRQPRGVWLFVHGQGALELEAVTDLLELTTGRRLFRRPKAPHADSRELHPHPGRSSPRRSRANLTQGPGVLHLPVEVGDALPTSRPITMGQEMFEDSVSWQSDTWSVDAVRNYRDIQINNLGVRPRHAHPSAGQW